MSPKGVLTTVLAVLALGVTFYGTASAVITSDDIDAVIAQIEADRAVLDAPADGDPTTVRGVVREARSGCQDRLIPILQRSDLTAGARTQLDAAYQYLCGPDGGKTDPATFSYAKRIHMAVQQFGSHVEQYVNRLRSLLAEHQPD